MKRGVLELADVIAVNKADEQHEQSAERAARELSAALRLLRGPEGSWQAPVVTCSGLHNVNLDRVWNHVQRHRAWLEEHGGVEQKRREQRVEWTRAIVRDRLLARLAAPQLRGVVQDVEAAVRAGEITPDQGASQILAALDTHVE
jgi:LAO/AO transport system kinase